MNREQEKGGGEPTAEELAALTQLGRVARLVQGGMTPIEAAQKMTERETAEQYVERNSAAMEAIEARLMSPEYLAKFHAAQTEPDPAKRNAALAQLKRENFSMLDMEAVHRTISARNRQMKREGMLPPDAPI